MRGGHIVKQQNKNMESEFLCGFNSFQLVHSIRLVKRDSLPLVLAQDGCALYCRLGFIHFGSAQRDGHGSDLQTVR